MNDYVRGSHRPMLTTEDLDRYGAERKVLIEKTPSATSEWTIDQLMKYFKLIREGGVSAYRKNRTL